MWTIFNPLDKDLEYEIDFKIWSLRAGETKKFPDTIAQEMCKLHGFLKVLEKAEEAVKKVFEPPKDLKKVEEARGQELKRDRTVKHPSTNPAVVQTGGFSSGNQDRTSAEFGDAKAGLPPAIKKEMVAGKLMDMDKDKVGWYGKGIESDNPLSK